MDSGLCLVSSLNNQNKVHQNHFYDPSWLQKQRNVPMNFVWPKEYLVNANEEFQAPLIDLDGFLKGNKEATKNAAKLIAKACSTHGFFQVINHGVDLSLISDAYDQMDSFFKLPIDRKLSVRKVKGSMWGYSGAHADRFSSKLPWKETLSFPFHDNDTFEPVVTNYFDSTLGEDFQQAG
jgi:hypothetical protein